METTDFLPRIAAMVREAERYRDVQSSDRIMAQEYYEGVMTDLPAQEDRSKVVMRVTRAAIQKTMASLVRTMLGSDEIFQYEPQTQDEVEQAQQQSDYINYVVMPESDGHNAIYDALMDACVMRNGILYGYAIQVTEVTTPKWTGQSSEALEVLLLDPEIEPVKKWRDGQDPETGEQLWALQAKRKKKCRKIVLECVDPADFLIDPEAYGIDDAVIVGTVRRKTRSDLIAMGYDRELVEGLPMSKADSTQRDAERQAKRKETEIHPLRNDDRSTELQEVDYYELFVKIDMDNDGIAELHRLCFGGIPATNTWLNEDDTSCDSVDFAEVVIKRKPHQREGISLTDDLAEIQRIQSYFLRQVADNVTWQNNLMMVYQEGSIAGDSVQDLYKPGFGKVLRSETGGPVQDKVQYLQVPFVAKDTFAMLDWFKMEGESRSGVNEAAGGLDPDALQNQTATATALIEQGGISQVELMVRTAAIGLQRVGRILMRLTVKHADKPRQLILRDKFVEVDPRQWNAELNCTVNVGLGAGTRERDLQAVQMVLQMQQGVLQMLKGPSPLVDYEHVSNTLKFAAESANLRRPRLHFGQPSKDELAQWMQQQAQKPDPEMMKEQAKAQGQMSIEQMKLAAERERAEIQAQVDRHKETVQSQAAVEEKRIVSQIEAEEKDKDRDLKVYEIDTKTALELLKLHVTDTAQANQQDNDNRHREIEGERAEKNAKADRDMKMAESEMTEGADGKPQSAALAALQAIREQMSKPKKVVTPDGEEFVMQ